MDDDTLCTFNGIDGATGEYLQPPLSVRQLADLARREPRYQFSGATRAEASPSREKGPRPGIDPRRLEQSGWGVVFPDGAARPEVREALAPLLELRKSQATRRRKGRYRELSYREGESKTGFLARNGSAPGPVEPDRLPYYLLLVGHPEEIPFEFQYQLDVQYAVGRLHFETLEEYERYARTVVEAETGKLRRSPSAVVFGPSNPNDSNTSLSANHLAGPLATTLAHQLPGWSVHQALREEATKGRLSAFLEGDEAPALLFTAGHGMGFKPGNPLQESFQGSLICQDWPGPGNPVQREHYFSADDLSTQARVAGMLAFHFSCYGAGTPRGDNFGSQDSPREIASHPFLSRLAKSLLAHPGGGALAVVGHIERAWSWSFRGLRDKGYVFRTVFESAFKRLTEGYPIGFVMEDFNGCYAELASDLDEEVRSSRPDGNLRLARLWTYRNDARNYVVLGDPAVRLAVPEAGR